MVYEGRRSAGRRRGRGKSSGGSGGVCMWLLILVVAAWALFPGAMGRLRDRAAGALGVDLDGAVRAFSEAREDGAGIFDAVRTSVKYAFGYVEGEGIPALDTGPEDGPEDAGTPAGAVGGEELGDLPLPEYVSAETPEIDIELQRPVEGEVISGFGYRRDETGSGAVFHYGADISVAGGARVSAMAGGEVMAVGESTTYGKYVIISHEGGVETICAHLGETKAAGGEKVEAGQEIGVMEENGGYLHLEVIVDGMYVDPAGYL